LISGSTLLLLRCFQFTKLNSRHEELVSASQQETLKQVQGDELLNSFLLKNHFYIL